MSSWIRVCVCVLLVLSLVGAPSPVGAQKKPSPAALKKKANIHYENARDHYDHKEYLAAAAEYEMAFSIFPNPDYVFNIAQAYRLAGNLQVALDNYTKYLELAPDGRGAADARANRAALEAQLAEASAETKRLADEKAAEEKRLADEKAAEDAKQAEARKNAEARGMESQRSADIVQTGGSSSDQGSKSMRIAGIATFGAGVVALGLGIKFGLDAKSLESDVMENWDPGDFDDGESAERNAFVFYGVGVVAVTAGSVLYLMGRSSRGKSPEQKTLSVVPSASAQGASLLVLGSF